MFKDFYDIESEPIVKLESFYGPKRKIVEKCIFIFSKVIYDHILEEFDCEKIFEVGSANGNKPIWSFNFNNEKIAFYLSPIGSSGAGESIVEVNHLTGASKFIMFGSCGSLDKEKTKGKFIVPTKAYRGEGLSYYYAKASDYIDIKNHNVVKDIFLELKIPFVDGRVWTTDSMLRETVNLVNKRKNEGCICVEMELAGVQAVCDFYGLELYNFLATGDILDENNYDVSALSDANHNVDKLAIALEIIKKI